MVQERKTCARSGERPSRGDRAAGELAPRAESGTAHAVVTVERYVEQVRGGAVVFRPALEIGERDLLHEDRYAFEGEHARSPADAGVALREAFEERREFEVAERFELLGDRRVCRDAFHALRNIAYRDHIQAPICGGRDLRAKLKPVWLLRRRRF